MSDNKLVYVHNKHIAPITAKARDDKGKVVFAKVFQPEHTDLTTGRQISTGYTSLTEAELDALNKSSKTFVHYRDKLNLLTVQDDLPAYAKAPHEALADARAESRRLSAALDVATQEVARLEAELLDEREKYSKLESASTDAEKLQPLNDLISELTAQKTALTTFTADKLAMLLDLVSDGKSKIGDVRKFAAESLAAYKGLVGAGGA